MWEFAPVWWQTKMTKSQVRKYIKDMEERRKKAQEELEKLKNQENKYEEELEFKKLEQDLDELL